MNRTPIEPSIPAFPSFGPTTLGAVSCIAFLSLEGAFPSTAGHRNILIEHYVHSN
jgi:hypothetical protein